MNKQNEMKLKNQGNSSFPSVKDGIIFTTFSELNFIFCKPKIIPIRRKDEEKNREE
jgi:hypothetical protein